MCQIEVSSIIPIEILILFRESNYDSLQILPSLLLMASSLLQRTNWDSFHPESDGNITRSEFSDLVMNWCFRLVRLYSMEFDGGEDILKVLTAMVIALVTCSLVNQNPLAVQVR